jgi:NCS1 family nucleobase:cation symporter-1
VSTNVTNSTVVDPSDSDDAIRLGEDKRDGNPRTLGAAWAGVLLAPGTIITGMVAAGGSAGPGFGVGFAGLAIGTIIGTFFVALISIWGPRTGLAQMPLGKLAFGAANVLPQVFLIFSLIAYDALNDLFGVDALADALGIEFYIALACILAIEVVVVSFGVRLMRILGLVLSSVMLIVAVWLIFAAAGTSAAPAPAGVSGFPLSQFTLAMALGLSGSISWSVQACDLSRTLPHRTSPKKVFAWVFVGMTIPLVVLGGIGAWISTDSSLSNPMGRVQELLGGGVGAAVALVALGISLATANALNDFSGGLSLVQMGVRIPRVAASLVITASGLTLAIVSRNTELGSLTQDIVLIAGYYTTPWLGVLLVEMIARRKEPKPWLIPASKPRQAASAFVLGWLLLLPFTATPIGNQIAGDVPALSWIGWFSRELFNGGGIGYLVGVIFGFAIYAALRLTGSRHSK